MTPRRIVDDGFDPPEQLARGQTEVIESSEPGRFAGIRAVLWLPDPEQRHGWREFYVREPEPKPGQQRKGIGF